MASVTPRGEKFPAQCNRKIFLEQNLRTLGFGDCILYSDGWTVPHKIQTPPLRNGRGFIRDKKMGVQTLHRPEHAYACAHGLMTVTPAASNGLVSLVATAKPLAAAIAAM